MLNINRRKLKAYGDRLGDGIVQVSFTLPVPASPEAKEAARIYAEKMGLEKVSIATMESMGENFSFFIAYGAARHTIDFANIRVPKVKAKFMDYASLKDYMSRNISRPIVVVGATPGADAHTVGIDAIMNMKGLAGDYGLERYPLFHAHNLRSQVTNEELVAKAVELKADAILISQVVTQRDSHIKNLKEFLGLVRVNGRISKNAIIIVGGPRIDHSLALKLGYDAGFGVGTKPSQVASFIVHEYMKRHGIKERAEAQPSTVRCGAQAVQPKLEPEPEPESKPIVQIPTEESVPHKHHHKRIWRGRRHHRPRRDKQ